MSGIGRRVRGGVLAAGALGALGFGAAEAFARPPEAEAGRVCIQQVCNACCEARFGPFASGWCVDGRCRCAV